MVIVDGMAGLPHRQLNDKTCLESAEMPNLAFLATRGQIGHMYPVRPNFVPEADQALVSIFGNEPSESSRGWLEVVGAEVKLTRGDLALRVNFATIDSQDRGNILDRRVGRMLKTSEVEELTRAIAKIELPVKFLFVPTTGHRAVLVLKGGFSSNISTNDTIYSHGKILKKDKINFIKPYDEDENAQYTANVVNEFLDRAHEVLEEHPINLERKRKGLLPANYLLVRGPSMEAPKLKPYKKWVAAVYSPMEIGFAKLSGMKVYSFDYPKFKDLDSYKTLHEALAKGCKNAIKTIRKSMRREDYVYIHLNEPDLAGHDNKPLEKKAMLEYIDKTLFKFLRKIAPYRKIPILITSNHATPCKLKDHTADSVPVIFYNNSLPEAKEFHERAARLGKLGSVRGGELLKRAGFLK